MATPYSPKAALGPRAGGAVILAGGLAGALAGVGAHLASRALYLAFLVPVAWGLVVGLAVAVAARKFRVPRPAFAALAASAGVMVAAASQLGLDYRIDRHERAIAAAEVYDMSSMGAGPTELIEERYEARLAELGFGDYARRRYGIDPNLDPASGLASSLGPRGTIALSALELVIAIVIAIALARRQALAPACPSCGAWRVEAPLGVGAQGVASDVVDCLLRDRPEAAAARIVPPDTREVVSFSRLSCPAGHDGRGGVLRIVEHELDKRRETRAHQTAELEVSGEELGAVAQALEEAGP